MWIPTMARRFVLVATRPARHIKVCTFFLVPRPRERDRQVLLLLAPITLRGSSVLSLQADKGIVNLSLVPE